MQTKRCGGFSLVEVLIATAIFALAAVGFFGAIHLAQVSRSAAEETVRVEQWISRHHAQLRQQTALPTNLTPPPFTPSDPDALGGTVSDLYEATDLHGLYRVTSSITYQSYIDRPTTYSLSAFVNFSN